jgi:hypothetical protein
MFNIDIASLRDPATLESIERQLHNARAVVHAYRTGRDDAQESLPYNTNTLYAANKEEKLRVLEAYNLGWDTVRLQRGVNKNAK